MKNSGVAASMTWNHHKEERERNMLLAGGKTLDHGEDYGLFLFHEGQHG